MAIPPNLPQPWEQMVHNLADQVGFIDEELTMNVDKVLDLKIRMRAIEERFGIARGVPALPRAIQAPILNQPPQPTPEILRQQADALEQKSDARIREGHLILCADRLGINREDLSLENYGFRISSSRDIPAYLNNFSMLVKIERNIERKGVVRYNFGDIFKIYITNGEVTDCSYFTILCAIL